MSSHPPPPHGWSPAPQGHLSGPYGQQYPRAQRGPGQGRPGRGRTAGLVAAIVSIVLVVTAVVVAVVIAFRAGEDPGTEVTEVTEVTDRTSADGYMTGALYRYELPPGWRDITEDLSDQATVDTISGDGEGVYSSESWLIVELGSTFGASSPDELKETWKQTLTGTSGLDAVDTEETTIAGQRAVTVQIEQEGAGDLKTIQYGYLLIVDNRAVSIVLTTSANPKSTALTTLDEILSTWQWN